MSAHVEPQHADDCAIMPIEEWDGVCNCDCGCWEKRAEASGSNLWWQFVEERLWLPANHPTDARVLTP